MRRPVSAPWKGRPGGRGWAIWRGVSPARQASLIPGGAADTDFVSAPTREKMAAGGRSLIHPDVMIAPLLWLCSPESDGITGGRYVGRLWDTALPPSQAAPGAREAPVLRDPATETR